MADTTEAQTPSARTPKAQTPRGQTRRTWGGWVIRWLGRVLLAVVLVLLVLGLFLAERVFNSGHSLPRTEGTLAVPGLNSPVEIIRDRYGIAHVVTDRLDSAMTALGLAHAQDRLWQMVFFRAAAGGRLAEIAGSPALPVDRTMRALGFADLAQKRLALLSPRARSALEAYAKGVNQEITGRDRRLPLEFSLLQVSPDPWRAEDSLMLMDLLALSLSTNAFMELARVELSKTLDAETIAELLAPFPGLPDGVDLDPFKSGPSQGQDLAALEQLPAITGASNNWAVDGSRSASGAPLLANDPHLGLNMPGLWYLAHLYVGDKVLAGATIPGIPAILLGRTNDLSWGFTNTGTDVQDLVLERLDPADEAAYLTPDGPRSFETREETIKVRLGRDEIITIRKTRNGPVLPILDGEAPDGHVYALRWTALEPSSITFESTLAIFDARTIDEARKAMAGYVTPTQSMVFADTNGGIGFLAAGDVPVRGADHGGNGLVPATGWDQDALWPDRLTPDQWPAIWRPESGYVLTANNDIRPDGYPHHITSEWNAPDRANRIRDLLTARPIHDVESFAAIMTDTRTGFVDHLLPLMLDGVAETPDEDPRFTAALARLRAWDGFMDADKSEPLIMAAWLTDLTPQLVADELGADHQMARGIRTAFLSGVLGGKGTMARWCDRTDTEEKETCGSILAASLNAALDRLSEEYGADPEAWRWGVAHQARNLHLPLGLVPVIGDQFSRYAQTPGGRLTVNRASYSAGGDRPFLNVHGGGYRAIYDMGAPENSVYMIATGQSGNIASPHYDDLLPLWADGVFIPMVMDAQTARRSGVATLALEPSPGE